MNKNDYFKQVISEIDISKYNQKEYSEIVNEIFKAFDKKETETDYLYTKFAHDTYELLRGFWVFTDTTEKQKPTDMKISLKKIGEKVENFLIKYTEELEFSSEVHTSLTLNKEFLNKEEINE
jgi:hypothetical protein